MARVRARVCARLLATNDAVHFGEQLVDVHCESAIRETERERKGARGAPFPSHLINDSLSSLIAAVALFLFNEPSSTTSASFFLRRRSSLVGARTARRARRRK